MAFDGIGLDVEVVELLQPGVLVRREDAVGLAAAGQDLAAFEDDVVLRGVQGDAAFCQRTTHGGIAGERVRIVVVARIDGLHVQVVGQGDDLVGRLAVPHQQANPVRAVRLAERGQRRIERHHALLDELHAPVGPGQRAEDLGVVDEHAPDLARRPQGEVQGRVIVSPQVAAEPDERGVEDLFHAAIIVARARSAPAGIKIAAMPASINLTNQFLIAMPGMGDSPFAGTVVYMCEHTDKGALGLVINKPIDITLKNLFEKVELSLDREDIAASPVFFGGPVQTERGFVLHEGMPDDADEDAAYNSSLKIEGGLAMTTSKDVLEAMANGSGPKKVLVTLGYSGWGAGQLEDEMSRNGWINVDAETRHHLRHAHRRALRQGALPAWHRCWQAQLGGGATREPARCFQGEC